VCSIVTENEAVCFVVCQIEAGILQAAWQVGTKDKDKALVAKQKQIEEAYQHELELKKKQEQVCLRNAATLKHL
jgi:hypothetical protein